MRIVDTLIHARWLIPVEPANTVLEKHSLVVSQGNIVDILPSTEAQQQYQSRYEVTLPHHAVMPGLINTHTHASMSLFRGYADDLHLMDWLENHIWPAETKWVSPEFVYDGTQLAIAEMIRGGITCFNDMYFFPDQAASAAKNTGMRAVLGLILIDFPTTWANSAAQYLEKGLAVHQQYLDTPLISTAFAPHAPYTVSDEPLTQMAILANELDIPIHMHIHETAFEVSQSEQQHKKRPLARLDDLGLLSPRLMAVHMTQLTDNEIERCAESGLHIIHCPESNMKLASGFCPIAKLSKAGVNIALGTDGAASNNDLDIFGEMRCTALLAKAVANDASVVPAQEALQMATLNGARALGLGDITGSLKPGKAADVIAINLSQIETQPIYDAISQIVYSTNREKVSDVWIAGQHIMKNRQLQTLDESEILAKVKEWTHKINQT